MSSSNDTQSQPATSGDEYPSLNLVFDLVRERLAQQTALADAMDSKASAVLGAASVVIGLAVALQAAVPIEQGLSMGNKLVRTLPLVPLLVAYFVTAWTAYQAFTVRKYDYAPTPTRLLDYVRDAEWFTKARVVKAMEVVYEDNATVYGEKAKWLRRSLWALTAQVVVLGLALMAEILVS